MTLYTVVLERRLHGSPLGVVEMSARHPMLAKVGASDPARCSLRRVPSARCGSHLGDRTTG